MKNKKWLLLISFLFPKQIKDSGLVDVSLKYSNELLLYIVRHYAKEAGVRQLDRELGKITRKIARSLLEAKEVYGTDPHFILTPETVSTYLGPEKYSYGKKEGISHIGLANGMAWTQTGGDLLKIETAFAFGKGNVIITGNLGDVMKESVNIAIA